MIPSNNGKVEPCSHISSNCVVWQGPDIECINLCNGDTVSDVVAKLATEVCDLIDGTCTCNPTLDITVGCLTGISDPTDLDEVINAIITELCTTSNARQSIAVANITGSLALPVCLQYTDPSTGQLVTQLPIETYATRLAAKICDLNNAINIINTSLTNFESRLSIIESCVLPCTNETNEVEVVSSCLFSSELVKSSTLLLALETAYCQTRDAIGQVPAINNAINAQCIFGTDDQLSSNGTYSGNTLWTNTPSNLADSHKNQWVVICDLYNAVQSIQENCCDSGCAATTFNFATTTIETLGVATAINFNFTTSTVPRGFSDCGSMITITDQNGASVTQAFDVYVLQSNPTGTSVTVTALDVTAALSIKVDFCASDNDSTCEETINRTIPLGIACPSDFAVSNETNTTVDISFTNGLGTTVTYEVEVTDNTTGNVASTVTISSPGVSVSETISGLSKGTSYNFTLKIITSAGLEQVCPAVIATTTGTACTVFDVTTAGTPVSNPETDWIYLGYDDTAPTDYYYDADAQEIIAVARTVTPVDIRTAFDGGGATDPTVSGAGVVDFDISTAGMTASDTITASYSADGITFVAGGTVNGSGISNPYNFNFATGATSGKLYIRVRVENAGSLSAYAEFVWDFESNFFIRTAGPLTNILADGAGNAHPNGLSIESQSLTCGTNTYNITGSKIDFYYVRPITLNSIQYYMYVAFTNSAGPNRVVFCCDAPSILGADNVADNAQEYVEYGGTGVYNINFILGEGDLVVSVTTPPVAGTLVDNGTVNSFGENRNPLNRRFTYTHDGATDHSDIFSLQLTNSAGTVTETRSYQIQVIPDAFIGLPGTAKNIFAFIDTTSYTVTRGTALINGLNAWATQYATDCSWTGSLYIVPVQDNNHIGYIKAVVDTGTSASLDPAAGWVALRSLPTDWTGGAAVPNPGVMVLSFSNESDPDYHNSTLAAGWALTSGFQPSTAYQNNYDELHDIINGTGVSTWGATQAFGGTPPFSAGFSILYYPTTGGPAAAEAAAVLQGLGSYYARMIDTYEYGVKTAADVTSYLLQGVTPSAVNPYEGSKTTTGIAIEGLLKKNFMMMLNQGYTAPADWDFASDRFKDDMTAAANAGSNAACPSVP